MSANSKIEWTDHTFNPWIGCTKVSPGCAHCYAEARDKRFGKDFTVRRRTSAANWRQPLKWNRDVIYERHTQVILGANSSELREMPRPRVFCASLADWLDDEVPIEWLADLLALTNRCQNLDFQLLTKRPENWNGRLHEAFARDVSGDLDYVSGWLDGDAPHNVWIGTSVEDQKRADERIPALLKIPAKIRFLSCEPLLGPVDVAKWLAPDECGCGGYDPAFKNCINWVIVGGESGPKARPMHPDWARSLRDQCVAAGVPFFFKQWGEYRPGGSLRNDRDILFTDLTDGGDNTVAMQRLGKHAAGRLLDGVNWSQFPSEKSALSAVQS